MDSKSPIEVLDDLLNAIQTFPLDTQHYTKQIIDHEKLMQATTHKLNRAYKRILMDPDNMATRRQIKRYERIIKKSISAKMKAAQAMFKIITEIKKEMKNKFVCLEEPIDFTLPSTNNLPNVIRTGSRVPNDDIEPLYCVCGDKSHGDMVGCDSSECKIGWFHFSCVGLTNAPKGRWYCNDCRKRRKITRA